MKDFAENWMLTTECSWRWLCGVTVLAWAGLLTFGPAGWRLVGGLAFVLGLTVMGWLDSRTGFLPDRGNLVLALLALLFLALGATVPFADAVLGCLLGGFLLLSIRWLSHGGLGLGDVNYVMVLGLWLGWQSLLVALLTAFAVGAFAACCLIAAGRASRRQCLPFGPFLSLGGYVG